MNQEAIENELVKANITDQVIAKMKSDYMELKVKDRSDKVGFEAVSTARKEVKKFRVSCEKLLKQVREPAVSFQKSVVAKEKEVVAKISEIEEYLTSQEEIFNPKEIVAEDVISDSQRIDMYVKSIKNVKLPEVTEPIAKKRLETIVEIINKL